MATFSIFDVAGQAMSAQNIRLNTIASNMANAETVGSSAAETYRAKYPVFSAVKTQIEGDNGGTGVAHGVKVDKLVESDKPLQVIYDPSHPKADKDGFIYKSNVNIVQEMADMISASRSFQTNVQMLNTAKELMQHAINLGR